MLLRRSRATQTLPLACCLLVVTLPILKRAKATTRRLTQSSWAKYKIKSRAVGWVCVVLLVFFARSVCRAVVGFVRVLVLAIDNFCCYNCRVVWGSALFLFSFFLGVFVVSSSVLVAVRGGALLGGGACAVFAWRSVVGSALRAGCVSWSLGASSRSFSGWCVRVSFSSSRLAGSFARVWAARVGFGCVVRSVGGRFVVSVPAAPCVASSLRAFVGWF